MSGRSDDEAAEFRRKLCLAYFSIPDDEVTDSITELDVEISEDDEVAMVAATQALRGRMAAA